MLTQINCKSLTGMEDCVIGMQYSWGRPPVLVYDFTKVSERLMAEGRSEEDIMMLFMQIACMENGPVLVELCKPTIIDIGGVG